MLIFSAILILTLTHFLHYSEIIILISYFISPELIPNNIFRIHDAPDQIWNFRTLVPIGVVYNFKSRENYHEYLCSVSQENLSQISFKWIALFLQYGCYFVLYIFYLFKLYIKIYNGTFPELSVSTSKNLMFDITSGLLVKFKLTEVCFMIFHCSSMLNVPYQWSVFSSRFYSVLTALSWARVCKLGSLGSETPDI